MDLNGPGILPADIPERVPVPCRAPIVCLGHKFTNGLEFFVREHLNHFMKVQFGFSSESVHGLGPPEAVCSLVFRFMNAQFRGSVHDPPGEQQTLNKPTS